MADHYVSLHAIVSAIDSAIETLEGLSLTGEEDTKRDSAVNALEDLKNSIPPICGTQETSHVMRFVS